MLGQSAIHVGCMWYGVKLATDTMGPDELKAVMEFHKAAKVKFYIYFTKCKIKNYV